VALLRPLCRQNVTIVVYIIFKGDFLMKIEVDTHCHTVASTHAYSTVLEMATYAARKGLLAIAITDHGSALPDGPHDWHFGNLRSLPRYIEGVLILRGAEANILDYDGNLDVPLSYLNELDWIIASLHDPCCPPASFELHTKVWMEIAQNPYVDVIGHSGNDKYKFDYDLVMQEMAKQGKIVEINNHSFTARLGSHENCRNIALACKKHQVPIVVSSDAHCCFDVGDFDVAIKMLKEIDFPEKLIVNLKLETLLNFIQNKRNRKF
jgi:putative hydrolase